MSKPKIMLWKKNCANTFPVLLYPTAVDEFYDFSLLIDTTETPYLTDELYMKHLLTSLFSLKSIPTVDINRELNIPSVYWYKKLVLPTPESPRARNLIK